MGDPLQSARTKLARANLHKATANRETVRFFDRQPAPTFEVTEILSAPEIITAVG
jgi:hypothetical protein